MKKLKISFVIIIAILGAYLIYKHFDNLEDDLPQTNKFASEYTLLDESNIFVYKNIDEIINILTNNTGVVFFCTKDSNWCQHYAYYLNETLKEYGIKEINYLDIKKDRQLNTSKYQKIVNLLSNNLYTDDLNNKNIFMPDLTFVKDGVIIAHNNDTSLIASEGTPEEYWNQENINNFKNILKEYVIMLNEKEI